MKPVEPAENRNIPVVDFYGDAESWPSPELIHSEPLSERSRLHHWRIRPHRHSHLTQLFLLLEGSGTARLDSVTREALAPCILIIPERCVHDFVWDKGSGGFVLSITSALRAELEKQIGVHATVYSEPTIVELNNDRDYLKTLFSGIHDEFIGNQHLKEMSLECRIGELTVWLARALSGREVPASHSTRSKKHHARFTHLVEVHHKSQWSVADYANAVGITPSHLNAICRHQSGKSALRSIHERLVLAARRDLVYTEKTIAGVAHKLGFADPSYFTRFFKRETGIAPSEYRRESGTDSAGHAR